MYSYVVGNGIKNGQHRLISEILIFQFNSHKKTAPPSNGTTSQPYGKQIIHNVPHLIFCLLPAKHQPHFLLQLIAASAWWETFIMHCCRILRFYWNTSISNMCCILHGTRTILNMYYISHGVRIIRNMSLHGILSMPRIYLACFSYNF